jgi:oligopeptide/dipeptide ABC transporter ATP-binding protein
MALLCKPRLLLADEPTTALDVTIQAQILELLEALQERHGTAILLVTHSLGVVAGAADRVLVMYAGRIVESSSTPELFARPEHPYTQGLLASAPRIDGALATRLSSIPGQPPDPARSLQGCSFAPRCAFVHTRCERERPVLEPESARRRDDDPRALAGDIGAHRSACFVREDLARAAELVPHPRVLAASPSRNSAHGLHPSRTTIVEPSDASSTRQIPQTRQTRSTP